MKKIWLILSIFSFTTPSFGGFITNPGSPAIVNQGIFSGVTPAIKFSSGYRADYTSNKRFVPQDPRSTAPLKEFGIHSQMASVSASILRRIEFFGSAGGSKEHASWNRELSLNDYLTVLKDFKSDYTFSWGFGAKAILIEWWQTYLGVELSYFDVPANHKSYFSLLNHLNLNLDPKNQTFHLREWQLGLGIASKFPLITPYGGVRYLDSKMTILGQKSLMNVSYKNKENLGYFYGLTISLFDRFHITLERRVVDEFSYSFSAVGVF
jgi:hypothetical protein